jgi:hypothetical protein
MSKVKIQGHASGTGVLTVTAPNTSTDRTITLPDSTGTLATTADTFNPDAAVTINESGADVDFRVESDNDANALFVQGSNGLVGIGTSSPPDGISLTVSNDGSGAHQPGIRMIDTNSGNHHQIYVNAGSIYFRDVTAGTTRMVINSSGVMSVPAGIELGSGIDATAANTLEDYEEGTWTPTFSGSHIGSHTLNYAIYTKIGRLVKIEAYVYNFGSIGGNGISFGITGLPFSPNQQSMGATTCTHTNVDDSTVNLSARQYLGTIYIEQTRDNASGGWTPYNDFNGNSHVQISLSYTTAA